MARANTSITAAPADTEQISYTDVVEARGQVKMYPVSEDKVDRLLGASSSLVTNLFFFVAGVTFTVYVTIRSGSYQEASLGYLQAMLTWGIVVTIAFGLLTIRDVWERYTVRHQIKNTRSVYVRCKNYVQKWRRKKKRSTTKR